MRRIYLLCLLLFGLPIFAQTVPTSVSVSPHGAAIKNGTTQTFTVTCTYSAHASDDCTYGGGATWVVFDTASYSVSNGVVTATADPGIGQEVNSAVEAKVQGVWDRAGLITQHTGDTWYMYPTPQYNNSLYTKNDSNNIPVQQNLNVVVGSTVSIGEGAVINGSSGGTSIPFSIACTWQSSNTAVATVSNELYKDGQVTAIAPGTVTITCNQGGNASYGTSTASGWQSPGNFITLTVINGGTSTNTWYVRSYGDTLYSATNTSGHCDGKHDASYPGTGVNQPCAAKNLRDLWANNVTYYSSTWVAQGGDIIDVDQQSASYWYNVGYDDNNYTLPHNYVSNNYMPSIPSGTASRHTILRGSNYANCSANSAKTRLQPRGIGYAINVSDSQYVDIQCFEISQLDGCGPGIYTHACGSTDFPGSAAIIESGLTANVTYTDINMHGLENNGIIGAAGVGVSANRIRISGTGGGGLNMDDNPWTIGNQSKSAGFDLENSTIQFVGCIEEYPITHNYPLLECIGYPRGYGDAVGTAAANGDWKFVNNDFDYNMQDGPDMLHSGLHSLTIIANRSVGNIGQPYKLGSALNVVFRANFGLSNCARTTQVIGDEPATAVVGYNGESTSVCRAQDTLPIQFDQDGTYVLQGNTLGGYQPTFLDIDCFGAVNPVNGSCTTAKTTLQDNIFFGLASANSPGDPNNTPGLFYVTGTAPANNGWVTRDHNQYYNFRGGCPTLLTGELCSDPLFINEPNLTTSITTNESILDSFNFGLKNSSPAKYAGVAISGLTTDNKGNTYNNPPSMGALEYQILTNTSIFYGTFHGIIQ